MAKQVTITDDVTGEIGARTVTFSVAERRWEIDVNDATIEKMVTALKRYTDKGREIQRQSSGNGELATIRAWAKLNGWPDLGDRGRVPQEAQDAYHAAHPVE